MSTLLKCLQSSKQFVLKHVYVISGTELKRKYMSIINLHGINFCEPIASRIIIYNSHRLGPRRQNPLYGILSKEQDTNLLQATTSGSTFTGYPFVSGSTFTGYPSV